MEPEEFKKKMEMLVRLSEDDLLDEESKRFLAEEQLKLVLASIMYLEEDFK